MKRQPSIRLPRQCCNATNTKRGKPKVCYRTEAEALEHVGPGQEAYWCGHCCNYHVGKPKRREATR